MSKLDHLKSQLEAVDIEIKESCDRRSHLREQLLKSLGFELTKDDTDFIAFRVWEYKCRVFVDDDQALEFAEEEGLI